MAWADHARGIAIALVVLGHTLSGLKGSRVLVWSAVPAGIYDTIYSFHMPLFFVVSGMFLGRSRARTGFFAQKAQTLLYPYVVWSALHGLVGSALGGFMNEPVTLASAVAGLLVAPVAQFWFLPTLFVLSALAGLASRWRIGDGALLMLALAAWALGAWPEVFSALGVIPRAVARFGLYFATGLLLGERSPQRAVPRAALVPGAAALLVVAVQLRAWHEDPLWSIVPAVCGIVAVIAIGTVLGDGCRPLQRLGRWSLAIYLGHVMAGAGTRVGLLRLGVIAPAVHVGLGMLVGVGAPAVLGWARDRGWLGFLFVPQGIGWTSRSTGFSSAAPYSKAPASGALPE